MTLATPTPWADDTDPLAGLKWGDEDVAPDPDCEWCDDTGWRWVLGAGHRAEYIRCDKCFEGDEPA